MPEGPEIWILKKALNKLDKNYDSIGKHLYIIDKDEDWSFGLSGRVEWTNEKLYKKGSGWAHGKISKGFPQDLGIDWMSATKPELEKVVKNYFTSSRKKLGPLLLDQSIIAGIGVAWGSEILYASSLHPDKSANEQDLSKLADVAIKIRDKIKKEYLSILKTTDPEDFVNEWFGNLYETRIMKVYKTGKKFEVGGRTWWV